MYIYHIISVPMFVGLQQHRCTYAYMVDIQWMCPMNQECKQLSTISPNCADQIIGGLISAVVDVEQDMDIATPKLR